MPCPVPAATRDPLLEAQQLVSELETRHCGETEELLQLLVMERARAVGLEVKLQAAVRRGADLLAMVESYQVDADQRQEQKDLLAAEGSNEARKVRQLQLQVGDLRGRIQRLEDENVALIEAHGPLPM